MQDPTLAVKEGLREVETQLGKLRVLWSEAEFAKGAAEAEVKSLRAELARLRKETVRKDEEWQRGYEELRNRGDFELNTIRAELVRRETELGAVKDADWTLIASLRAELEQAELRSAVAQAEAVEARKENDVERFRARAKQDRRERFALEASLEAAHAAIWGLGCVVTNLVYSVKAHEWELKRLRRSNEQVREALGAKPGESPVDAAERLRAERDSAKAIMGQEIERLRNDRDAALGRVVKLENACRESEQAARALQESWNAVYANRDKALARVEELEHEVASLRYPRQSVRDECAAALFEVFRTSETLDTAFYGFDAALAVVAKELSALRKDRETLNRVRGAVEVKS